MQLIIRCFTFYSVLLFLWESSAAVDLDNKLNACEKALDDLFRLVADNLAGGTPKDFLFIPDKSLIKVLISDPSPEPKVEGKLWREPNEKVILNQVTFDLSEHTIYHGITFYVKHPKEGINPKIGKETRGTFRIVCRTNLCLSAVSVVWGHSSWFSRHKKIDCLRNFLLVRGPFISGSFAKGVEVRLPWDQRYVVFNAKTTLTSLMNRQPDTIPHRWLAKSALIFFHNSITYISGSDHSDVDIPVPELANKVVEEYVQAAIDFWVISDPSRRVDKGAVIKDTEEHRIIFHKIPRVLVRAVPNPNFRVYDAIPKLQSKRVQKVTIQTTQNIRQGKLAPQ